MVDCFKLNDINGRIWEVKFDGEASIDAGGPFRETLTNMLSELESTALPLLIPTVNNRMDHGFSRECWTLNPDANTPTQKEMFKYLGFILGFTLRTGSSMDWKFSPIFWKQLMDEPIVMRDFESFD